MKQLFVSSFLPQKNAPQAGHRLAFDFLSALAAENDVDVVLLSRLPIEEKDIEFRQKVGNVFIKYVNRTALVSAALGDPLHFSPRFFTRYTKEISRFLCELVEKNGYDTVRLEFTQCFAYAFDLKRRFGDRIRIELSMHDVFIQVVLRTRSIEGRLFAKQTFEYEQRVVNLADKVYVLSNKDAHLVRGLYPGVRSLEVVPIPLPGFLKSLRRTRETVQKGHLLFWGAMQRKENEEALLHFVESTFMPLRRRGLALKLLVVGSGPSERVKRLAGDDIVVTGFVDDPSRYFEAAEIGVVPLLSGAGVKLKTLEMLAARLPVVSTPVGAEGVEHDGELLRVCEIDRFADEIERLYLRDTRSAAVSEICQA